MMSSTNGHSRASERVALYMRVSSEEQVERMSIDTQEEFLEQYRALYGLEVVGVYRDEGISGTVPVHERPGGGRLLRDAEAGAFDTVLVYRLDRVGRSLLVVVDAHDRLMGSGAALKSANEPIDTSTPAGRLIFQMLASFAEFERGTIRERTQHGLHRAYRAGKHSGRIPYGYDVGEDGRLSIVVEEEAAIVREIIANIAGGATLYSEANRLDSVGVPAPGWKYRGKPRKHGAKWSPTSVHNICYQGAYAGVHRINTNGGKDAIDRAVPIIVEPTLRQRAMERLADNKRRYNRKTDRKYLLSGLVRCEACGGAYVGHPTTSKGKKFYYYKCSADHTTRRRRNPLATPGHAPYVPAGWLEELVWADVRRFIENPGEVLEKLREQMEEDAGDEALKERLEDLGRRLGGKQAEKDRYVRMYAQGHLDDSELATYLEDLRVQTDNLQMLMEATQADLDGRQEQKELAETTGTWLAALRERVEEVEADTEEAFHTRKELVGLLVDKIAAGRTEDGRTSAQITYRFGPPGPLASPAGEDQFVDSVPNPCAFLAPKPAS